MLQEDFTWRDYENFGQGQKREGCIKSIPEGGVVFLETGGADLPPPLVNL